MGGQTKTECVRPTKSTTDPRSDDVSTGERRQHAAATLGRHHHLPARASQRYKRRTRVRVARRRAHQVAPVHQPLEVLVADVGLDDPVLLGLLVLEKRQQLTFLHTFTHTTTTDKKKAPRVRKSVVHSFFGVLCYRTRLGCVGGITSKALGLALSCSNCPLPITTCSSFSFPKALLIIRPCK